MSNNSIKWGLPTANKQPILMKIGHHDFMNLECRYILAT